MFWIYALVSINFLSIALTTSTRKPIKKPAIDNFSLEKATLQMSACKSLTASQILPTICELQNKLKKTNKKHMKSRIPLNEDGFLFAFKSDQAAIALENKVCVILCSLSKDHSTSLNEPQSTKKMSK